MPPVTPDQSSCQSFTLAEIRSTTNNFDGNLVIGRGGSVVVYKCCREIGSVMEPAVKQLRPYSEKGALAFENERKVLSKLRHRNIVSLVGYCNKGEERLLVFEKMPNGTLKDYLGNPALSWSRLIGIWIDVARGINYMHKDTSTREGIIHRDVKSPNILLDANFVAKVSDFGTCQVCRIDQTRTEVITNHVVGTFGYMDPCYCTTGILTRKSDVYSFGVVLYEVLSGGIIVSLTLNEIKQKILNDILDPRLENQASNTCFEAFASIADKCMHAEREERPSMFDVMGMLQSLADEMNVMVVDAGVSSSTPNGAVSNMFVMQSGKVSSKPVIPLS